MCHKEFQGRADAKFDTQTCRKAYSRGVTDISVTKPTKKKEYTVAQWKEENPNPDFTPNWVKKGYKSREAAIKDILKKVQTDAGVINTGII